LRKLKEDDQVVIVRFNPWLAADSNALVISLLNSIVVELRRTFVVPRLGRDAARYARTLLSAIPRAEWLKHLIENASQEQRIGALAKHVDKTRRRVLVVLDDLDRMEAKELETVFKLLRGSDRLSNITFLCAYSANELARILETTRPSQDTSTFIEKFFPVRYSLPPVDRAHLESIFLQRLTDIITRFVPSPNDDLSKSLTGIWAEGAESYLGNLRRIKLFLNRIVHSLERIAQEVNAQDFVRLELIREIEPNLYERIYDSPEYFWSREFAFEAPFKGPSAFDEDDAKKERAAFYNQLKATVPPNKHYVLKLISDLFPHFAAHENKFTDSIDGVAAEKERRLCHPRYFRPYFLLKAPTELFSQKDFQLFCKSLSGQSDGRTIDVFNRTYRAIKEDYTRWHFMHLIDIAFDDFQLNARQALCRAMAQTLLWQADAFELLIANRRTGEIFKGIATSGERQQFVRAIVAESASTLYTLILIRRIEHDLGSVLPEGVQYRVIGFDRPDSGLLRSDIENVKMFATLHVRQLYLKPDLPSVFEQFGGLGSGVNRIEPNMFLFNWQHLGTDAQTDERKYIQELFTRRPEDLNRFLSLMFRAPFIDDYTQLKPLIDYKALSELIIANEDVLDRQKVEQFRERYKAEPRPDA
jgi:hypothetical protein